MALKIMSSVLTTACRLQQKPANGYLRQCLIYTSQKFSTDTGVPRPPKKPAGAYLVFFQERNQRLRDANPGVPQPQVAKMAGELWRNLPEQEKNNYQVSAANALAEYKRQHETYMGSLSTQQKQQLQDDKRQQQHKLQQTRRRRMVKVLHKPKNPASGYSLFLKEKCSSPRGATPIKEVTKMVAEEWKGMTEEDKEMYRERSKVLRAQYKADIAMWEREMISDGRPELVRGYRQKPSVKKAQATKPKARRKTAKKATSKMAKKKSTGKNKKNSTTTKTKKQKEAEQDATWMKEE